MLTRREAIVVGGVGIAGAVATAQAAAPGPQPVDEGAVMAGKVEFPPIHAETERPDASPPNPDPMQQRMGVAIVGLGRLALENVAPAIAQCKHVKLTGLVSGDPEKMRAIAAQYGVPPTSCYGYADLGRIRDNPAIDFVYIITPNALHHDLVIRAARAGKHVLCEKPMATSAAEARSMVEACRAAGKLLMVAYRCQYEVNNVALRKMARAGELGAIGLIDAINVQNQGDPSQWRQRKALAGGGSLPDVGLYCLNTSRALLGEEPNEVWATSFSPQGDPRFREVEANVSFTLRFPSGIIANCMSGYSEHQHRSMRVLGAQATANFDNAFDYEGQRLRISKRQNTAEGSAELAFGNKNQFALEMDHFAQCVRTGAKPRTPGEEGLQDHVIMDAIYKSIATGQPIKLKRLEGRDLFRGPEPAAG